MEYFFKITHGNILSLIRWLLYFLWWMAVIALNGKSKFITGNLDFWVHMSKLFEWFILTGAHYEFWNPVFKT